MCINLTSFVESCWTGNLRILHSPLTTGEWTGTQASSSLALQVNYAMSIWQQNMCYIVRFKVVLTCILDQICVIVRLLDMGVQNKRLYAFWAFQFLFKIKRPYVHLWAYLTKTKWLYAFYIYSVKTSRL